MACGGLATDSCGGPDRLTLMGQLQPSLPYEGPSRLTSTRLSPISANPSLIIDEAAITASLPTGWQVGPCVSVAASSELMRLVD